MLPAIVVGVGGTALENGAEVDGIDPAELLSVTVAAPAAFVIALMLFVPWPSTIVLPTPEILQA